MPRGTQLTEYEKIEIEMLHNLKVSNREIATRIKRSADVVNKYVKNPSNYAKKKRTGRKPKLSFIEKRLILRKASNAVISCSKIVDDLCLGVSRMTVNRVLLNCAHLKYQKKKTSPALKDHHKADRLKWAKEHMPWKSEWRNVVWSDEKRFNLDGPDGLHYYWHDLRKEKLLSVRRNAGGGSVMIWACFGFYGKSEICFVNERMNAKGYSNMLQNHLLSKGSVCGGPNWIFQQDNAPIHRAKLTSAWFQRKKISVLEWPALSPDLNPIENLWGILVRRVYQNGTQFANKDELEKAIVREWKNIELTELQNLVESMSDRIFDVIHSGGVKTKY
jgi:transposase